MPLELVCSKCKEVLYYGRVDYVPTSLSVPTLLRMMSVEQEPRKVYKDEDGYKCSKCHNVLKKRGTADNVEINPAKEQPPVAGKGSPYAGNGPIYTAGKKKGRRKKVWKGI